MKTASRDRLAPIHPGEILWFLIPFGMSGHELAVALRAPATRINEIVNEKARHHSRHGSAIVTIFGTTARFWLNLQAPYDLRVAEDQVGDAVLREVLPRTAS